MAGRIIDADKLKAHYAWWKGGTREITMDEAKSDFDCIIDLQPTVPTVEVEPIEVKAAYEQKAYNKGFSDGYAKAKEDIVRCKDCAYAVDEDEEGVYCSVNDNGFRLDDFCSLGEPIGEVEE
jgi:hypothetical protein